MLLNNKNGLNNSLGPDIYKDDLTALNYRALARCIAGCEVNGVVKFTSVDRVLNEFQLYDKDYGEFERYKEKYRQKKAGLGRKIKKCPVRLYNIETGEEKIFKTQYEASAFLGLYKSGVAYLLRKNGTSKSGWKAEYYEVGN